MTDYLKAIFDQAFALLLRRSLSLLSMRSGGVFLVLLCVFGGQPTTASAINYSYDSLNRLTNVNYGNGSVITYTYDAAGNRLTYSCPVNNDTIAPSITITNPTSGLTFTTTNTTLGLSGTASDSVGVTLVTWANDRGGIGTASGTTNWNISSVHLQTGANVISVTAYDAAGNNTAAMLTVTLSVTVPNYTITLSASPSSGGTVSGNGTFVAGSSRTVTAMPNTGYAFTNWTENGTGVSTSTNYTFTLNTNRTLVGNFVSIIPPPPNQLTGYGMSNGVFNFILNGPAGSNYVIYVSSDLVQWTPLSTNTIPSQGLIALIDPSAGGYPKRFYRAVPLGTVITGPPLPPQLTGFSISNCVFTFILSGPVGTNYIIQSSTNLVNWISISTNMIPAAGWVAISDPGACNQPVRFYRAMPWAPVSQIYIPAASGTITAPFILTNGCIYQTIQTTVVTNGGRAAYNFTIVQAGTYIIQTTVNAPNGAANSFFLNIDAEPQSPTMIWDIFPFTSGFEQRLVSWRGNGADTNNQYIPKVFNLTASPHQLIIRGREANPQLQSLTILPYP